MADKQKAALNRLSKKLSALRATLSKDERVLLDRIVLGTDEVVGHKAITGAAQSASKAQDSRNRAVSGVTTAAQGRKKVNEVAMHGMTLGSTAAASGGKAVKASKAAVSEVALHGMVADAASGSVAGSKGSVAAAQGAASGAATGAASAAANLLEFDAMTGGYRVTDAASI